MKYLLFIFMFSSHLIQAQTVDKNLFNPEKALNQARGETIGGCVLIGLGGCLFGGAMHRTTVDISQVKDRTNSLLWSFGSLSIGGGLTMIIHGGYLRVKAKNHTNKQPL